MQRRNARELVSGLSQKMETKEPQMTVHSEYPSDIDQTITLDLFYSFFVKNGSDNEVLFRPL